MVAFGSERTGFRREIALWKTKTASTSRTNCWPSYERKRRLPARPSMNLPRKPYVRRALEEPPWQDILAYGRERGQASGYTEDDVPQVVRENRRRHR